MKYSNLIMAIFSLFLFIPISTIAQKEEIENKPIDYTIIDFLLSENQFLIDIGTIKNNDPNRYKLLEGYYYKTKIFTLKENNNLVTGYKFGASGSDSFIYLLMVINKNSKHVIVGGEGLENDIIKLSKFFKEYNQLSFNYKSYCFNLLIDDYSALQNGIILEKKR